MIGIIGDPRRDGKSSFRTLIAYCLDREGVVHTGMRNIIFTDIAAAEMAAVAFQNTRCKDPLMHIILSWRELELPTKTQIDEAVGIALAELDLQDCQAVWIAHSDTENRHVHIVANRIDPKTHIAIQPAGRWTHRAVQRVARKIELAQGWSVENNGLYTVSDGTIVEKATSRTDKPKLSKTALDIEAHTAAKSAERICQEDAVPIIRKAKNWDELHQKLAEQGIAFERKGSGAVLIVNDIAVKASTAGRDISLSKLETKLGKYKPRQEHVSVAKRQSEPVSRVAERKVTSNWQRYTAARERYFQKKKESFSMLASRHRAELTELQALQRGERETLFSRSWKGLGGRLNRQRSVMAVTQKIAKLELRDRHKAEREELKRLYPTRFPSFKSWLAEEATTEAFISFRYQNNAAMRSGTESAAAATAVSPLDLRAFSPVVWNKGGVAYTLKDKGDDQTREAQFVDYGKRIVLSENCGTAAIWAAMQLANQKWGGAQIKGSKSYMDTCVELAIQHGLKISNPDLAAKVEEGRMLMALQKEISAYEREALQKSNPPPPDTKPDESHITSEEISEVTGPNQKVKRGR